MLLLVTMDLALGNYSPRLSESGGGGFVAGGRSEEYRANEAAGLVAAGGNQEAGKRDVVFKDCAEIETRNGLRLTQIFEIFFFFSQMEQFSRANLPADMKEALMAQTQNVAAKLDADIEALYRPK